MHRTYYTLLVKEVGKWVIEFGDYTRSTVKAEQTDLHHGYKQIPLTMMKIIETSDNQIDIESQVALLNGIPFEPKTKSVDI